MENAQELVTDKEKGLINAVVEYAEIAYSLEEAVLGGADVLEAKSLIENTLPTKTALLKFDQPAGTVQQRLEWIGPNLIERRELIARYREMAKSGTGLKEVFEERLKLLNKGVEVQLRRVHSFIVIDAAPFAVGAVIDKATMEDIASKLKRPKFHGVSIGGGLVLVTANDGDLVDGKFTNKASRRIADTMSHENYHALASLVGAHSYTAYMNLDKKGGVMFAENPNAIADAKLVDSTIYDMFRIARGEILPEVQIDTGAYEGKDGGDAKARAKQAYIFVCEQALGPSKEFLGKLRIALNELPPHWKIGEQNQEILKRKIGAIEQRIMDAVTGLFIARFKTTINKERRMLFYAGTFMGLEDFRILPQVADAIKIKQSEKPSAGI